MLKLYNSLTKKKEQFVPITPGKVSIYVCGITPYDTTHLGHAFTYISFDVLVRYLQFQGFRVNYTQNVTDINDRDNDILKRAKEQNISWKKLAGFWTRKFLDDMRDLNWLMPNNYVRASENLGPMLLLIQKLIKNKFAYEKNGSVYFNISRKKDYGKLSRFTKNKMLKIAKDFDEDIANKDKKNPLDITLWRGTNPNEDKHIPSFYSPFRIGRPGWHIECSAMATNTLGNQIDIHGGGIDLIYPHHEAEIAQTEGATNIIPFSRFWMHVASVSYKKEKMSKSLGNLVMISDLLKNYSSDTIRWYLISHHYRKPFEFFEEDLERSKFEFSKISEYINSQKLDSAFNEDFFNNFISALEDDLNTPLALKIISRISQNKGSVLTLEKCLSILGFSI